MAGILDKVLTGAANVTRANRPADQSKTEKVDRRDLPGGKKRAWTCGVIYKTSSSTTLIERWLEEHASGDWSLALENIDDAREAKTVKIFFVEPRDKPAFAAHFGKA
jgi:hypothetical protein